MWRKLKSILLDRPGSGSGGPETPLTDLFWFAFWAVILVFLLVLVLLIGAAIVGALRNLV